MKQISLMLAIFVLTLGCGIKISRMDPYPNINIDSRKEALSLKFGTNVKDSFNYQKQSSIRGGSVANWKDSLKAGFKNGFSDSYSITEEHDEADLTIQLNRADVEMERGAGGSSISWVRCLQSQFGG